MVQSIVKQIEQDDMIGKKVYILGTAESGPVNTPIKIISPAHASSIFGYSGSMMDSYRAMLETSFECDIYMVKVTGSHADLYLNINETYGEVINGGFYIKSKHANEKYNDIKIILDSNALYVHYDSKELGGYVKEYSFDDYITVHDLAEAINYDTRMLKGEIYCYVTCAPSTTSRGAFDGVNVNIHRLSGGNSGLYYNKNMTYNCLEETYGILEGMDIDLIVPIGVYFDDTFTDIKDDISEYYDLNREYLTLKNTKGEFESYYKQLLKFCRKQMRFSNITHGIMGLNLTEDPFLDEKKYINKLRFFKELNQDKEYEKYFQLISVCAGDVYTTFGTRIMNSASIYAPTVASVSVATNTTNISIPGSFTLFNVFSNEALRELAKIGYTCLRFSPLTKTVTVSSGVTTSNDERFKYLCNIRMIQLTMAYLKQYYVTLIGSDIITLMKTRQFENNINKILETLIHKGVILGFSINNIGNLKTGVIFVDLSLKTLYMLEDIRTYTGVAAM